MFLMCIWDSNRCKLRLSRTRISYPVQWILYNGEIGDIFTFKLDPITISKSTWSLSSVIVLWNSSDRPWSKITTGKYCAFQSSPRRINLHFVKNLFSPGGKKKSDKKLVFFISEVVSGAGCLFSTIRIRGSGAESKWNGSESLILTNILQSAWKLGEVLFV